MCCLGFYKAGGFNSLVSKYMAAEANVSLYKYGTNESCGASPHYAMHMFRDPRPGKSDIPWTGVFTGLPFSSMWYWCTDQVTEK